MKTIIAAIIVFLILFTLLILTPFTIVNAGHRGVVTHFGTVREAVLSEGFHWISPFDAIKEVDVRTQKVEATASAASKDLQTVTTAVAVNYRLIPETVNDLYQNVRGDYEDTVVVPAIQDSVKAATAQYTAEELITKRAEVSDLIKSNLLARTNTYSVIEAVAIVNFDFSESFNEAIEAKVTAEQDALAAKNKLEQTKYEAEQTIVAAQAEAESIRIQAEAITQQGGQAYVDLQWVNKWNGSLPSTVMGDAIPMITIGR